MAKKAKSRIQWEIEELERFAELRFRHLIHKYFGSEPDTSRLYQFIELLSYIFNLNQLQLNAACTSALNDYPLSLKKELALMYTSQHVPIVELCKTIKLSPPTYYEIIEERRLGDIELFPRYNSKQTREIVKLMSKLDLLLSLTL